MWLPVTKHCHVSLFFLFFLFEFHYFISLAVSKTWTRFIIILADCIGLASLNVILCPFACWAIIRAWPTCVQYSFLTGIWNQNISLFEQVSVIIWRYITSHSHGTVTYFIRQTYRQSVTIRHPRLTLMNDLISHEGVWFFKSSLSLHFMSYPHMTLIMMFTWNYGSFYSSFTLKKH